MHAFGVNFRIDSPDQFHRLATLFDALKLAKSEDEFEPINQWEFLLSEEARSHFYWPTKIQQQEYSSIRDSHPVAVTQPEDALGKKWDFVSVIEAIKDGEYSLTEIAKTSDTTAELRIDPEAYPYGGIGAFVALVEAHGMFVLGVNDYGKYHSSEELSSQPIAQSTQQPKPWWKFWRRRENLG